MTRILFGGVCALSLAVASACAIDAAEAQVPAFPGAEGAGAMSMGGRGGRVVRVTNLRDSGPGSLRAAVEAEGPRIVIFDVGGTISLERPLVVRNGRVTIAGQSAPGGGITLRDQPLRIAADDVVVRYIRSRLGGESGVEADAVWVSSGNRIILDHVSASWSTDEALSVSSTYRRPQDDLRDVTVQWSIIAESLCSRQGSDERHCFGTLAMASRGARISFHHNLWAHHAGRMPRLGNYLPPSEDQVGGFFDVRSNVFYNWGGPQAGYNGGPPARVTYNIADSVYLAGPSSTARVIFEERNPLASGWFARNVIDGAVPRDPFDAVGGSDRAGYRLTAPAQLPPVSADAAPAAFDRVLASAGASRVRDAVDTRIVESVRSRTGRLIDSQREVGGWPPLASGTPWRDSDADGIPDEWERQNALNPADPHDAGGDADGDGYTNVEEWLNSLV